jgi:hypothetical protein
LDRSIDVVSDWFVGGVAIVLGVAALWLAIRNDDRVFQLAKVRWLAELWGRGPARWLVGIIGALLFAGGIAIALGFSS